VARWCDCLSDTVHGEARIVLIASHPDNTARFHLLLNLDEALELRAKLDQKIEWHASHDRHPTS